jgi:subtilisin family serine protease
MKGRVMDYYERIRIRNMGLPPVQVGTKVKDTTQLRKLSDEGEHINWGQAALNIPNVWTQTKGRNVRVAVLDTGIDTDHPDLSPAISAQRDFTGEGIEDTNGHGTHCAGVIAARETNNAGLTGVAPEAELIIGKVLGEDGGTDQRVADAIIWAADKGADIISMSLGGPGSSMELFNAVHNTLARGVCIICAAGNEGSLHINDIGYPGRYGSVITVAAHDFDGNRAGFSSQGGEIDFMAPGTNVWSTYLDGGYATLSGTSMATPFVAGIAALIISKHHAEDANNNTPIDNNEDLRNHFLWMAAHPGHHDNTTGYGPLIPFVYFFPANT